MRREDCDAARRPDDRMACHALAGTRPGQRRGRRHSAARSQPMGHVVIWTTMMALSPDDIADLRRWLLSGAVIVLAHGAIAASMVNWRDTIEPAEPAAAIVIELAPLPVAPTALQTDIAPGVEQVMSEASPERPVEKQKAKEKLASKPVEEPPPEIKPAPNPD